MYLEKTIGVVVPAYNEERLITQTLTSIPAFVDSIIVANDASDDNTASVVRKIAQDDKRIRLVEHEVNQGVGGAIVSGYKKALALEIDVTAVMAGDAQMDPEDLVHIIDPIARRTADYTLTLQKSRMPQIQGGKGEAVVGYAELLPTKEMRYPRLSRRVNNLTVFLVFWISLAVNSSKLLKKVAKKDYHCFSGPFAMLFIQL